MYIYSYLGFIFLVCKLEKEEKKIKNKKNLKKSSRTSKIELFMKIVNGQKTNHLDVRLGSKYGKKVF